VLSAVPSMSGVEWLWRRHHQFGRVDRRRRRPFSPILAALGTWSRPAARQPKARWVCYVIPQIWLNPPGQLCRFAPWSRSYRNRPVRPLRRIAMRDRWRAGNPVDTSCAPTLPLDRQRLERQPEAPWAGHRGAGDPPCRRHGTGTSWLLCDSQRFATVRLLDAEYPQLLSW